ncbi:MAG: tetratricopeptide repeat protein [Bacteroidales bacterium]
MIYYYFRYIVLSIVLVSNYAVLKATNQDDSLVIQAKNEASKFLFENPEKSIIFGEKALKLSVEQNDRHNEVESLVLIARANLNLKRISTATALVDSASSIAKKNLPTEVIPELVYTKAELFQKQNRIGNATALYETAIKKASSKNDDQLEIMLKLSHAQFLRNNGQIDQALSIQKEALKKARKNSLNKLMAECNMGIGTSHFRYSQFNQAKDHYKKALGLYRQTSDTIGIISSLKNISLTNRDMAQYDMAEGNLMEALTLANTSNNPDELSDVYNLLGSLSVRKGKTTQALEYYYLSLDMRTQMEFLSSKASTLENISRVQKSLNDFGNAIENLQQALDIREKLANTRSIGSIYNQLGNLYADKGDLADALMSYLKSLKIRQETKIEADIASSLTNIGLTYRRLGSHQNALRYLEQALELSSEKQNPLGVAYIYIHHGNSLRDIDESQRALASYEKALELRKRTGNKLAISQALHSIARAHSDMENYPNAKESLNNALVLLKEINDEVRIADTYNELGNIATKEQQWDTALSFFQQASTLYAKHFELERRGLCIRKIGEIHLELKNYPDALENLQLALSISEKTNSAKLSELTYLALHDYYTDREQFKEALQFYSKHIKIRDSLITTTQREAVWQASLDLEMNDKVEEIRKIEGEVQTLRTEGQLKTIQLEQQRLQRNFFATVSIFIMVLAIGSIYGYIIIRKKNINLNETNEKLAKSEDELKKIVQTKDKLFSIIAHDLRSPFTALVGLTEVLAKQAKDLNPTEVSEYGNLIHESSGKLLNLIENLLQWSRSQTGRLKISPKKMHLNDVVRDVLSTLHIQADSKKIKIQSFIADDIDIIADYDSITAVFRNLVSNAIKFTEPEGSIRLEAKTSDDNVIINISDSGVGISQENLAKLFRIKDSFSTKGTSNEAGTGLGLIVCKEFVEKNNGRIKAKSKLGEGTTFTVTLPGKNLKL